MEGKGYEAPGSRRMGHRRKRERHDREGAKSLLSTEGFTASRNSILAGSENECLESPHGGGKDLPPVARKQIHAQECVSELQLSGKRNEARLGKTWRLSHVATRFILSL